MQADESIEPTGRFVVPLGEVDGGEGAVVLVGEEAGRFRRPATAVRAVDGALTMTYGTSRAIDESIGAVEQALRPCGPCRGALLL